MVKNHGKDKCEKAWSNANHSDCCLASKPDVAASDPINGGLKLLKANVFRSDRKGRVDKKIASATRVGDLFRPE